MPLLEPNLGVRLARFGAWLLPGSSLPARHRVYVLRYTKYHQVEAISGSFDKGSLGVQVGPKDLASRVELKLYRGFKRQLSINGFRSAQMATSAPCNCSRHLGCD